MSERSRLQWLCRRGTRELDWMLERFLDSGYDALDDAARGAFERFLGCEDDELTDWLIHGREPRDPAHAEIARAIRRHGGI